MDSVRVKTPARLHLGLLDLSGEPKRRFGGVGVALGYPNTELEVHPHRGGEVEVVGEAATEAKAFATRFLRHYGIGDGALVEVRSAIPKHVGLGSQTQLSLAVGVALAKLFGVRASVRELAAVLGRGKTSGIGIAAFGQGGFVVDGGRRAGEESPPPVVVRHPFPEDWAFVVAIPNVGRGLGDRAEEVAFRSLPPMPPETVGSLCRLVLLGMLPALLEADIVAFGEALTSVQDLVGGYFSAVQGAKYCHAIVGRCAKLMEEKGAYGVGQSSWGPATYGLVRRGEEGEIVRALRELLRNLPGSSVFCAPPNNTGAEVE